MTEQLRPLFRSHIIIHRMKVDNAPSKVQHSAHRFHFFFFSQFLATSCQSCKMRSAGLPTLFLQGMCVSPSSSGGSKSGVLVSTTPATTLIIRLNTGFFHIYIIYLFRILLRARRSVAAESLRSIQGTRRARMRHLQRNALGRNETRNKFN